MLSLISGAIEGNEYGEAQLRAVLAELLHNPRKWEAKKESSAAQPGKSGSAGRDEGETPQDKLQFEPKSRSQPWLEFHFHLKS